MIIIHQIIKQIWDVLISEICCTIVPGRTVRSLKSKKSHSTILKAQLLSSCDCSHLLTIVPPRGQSQQLQLCHTVDTFQPWRHSYCKLRLWCLCTVSSEEVFFCTDQNIPPSTPLTIFFSTSIPPFSFSSFSQTDLDGENGAITSRHHQVPPCLTSKRG